MRRLPEGMEPLEPARTSTKWSEFFSMCLAVIAMFGVPWGFYQCGRDQVSAHCHVEAVHTVVPEFVKTRNPSPYTTGICNCASLEAGLQTCILKIQEHDDAP